MFVMNQKTGTINYFEKVWKSTLIMFQKIQKMVFNLNKQWGPTVIFFKYKFNNRAINYEVNTLILDKFTIKLFCVLGNSTKRKS